MQEAEPLQQINRTYVRVRGKTLSYFGGCDYFRLASHPTILKAMSDGLKRYGSNVAASRMTTGNHELYPMLEKKIGRFFGSETALLTSTGYVTNLIVAQSFAGQFSHALIDERAHGALKDAAQFLDCPALIFRHRDVENFAATLKRCGHGSRPIVLTDGLFSHDGSVAPLHAYLKLLPRDGLLLVDDAHGAGTIGRNGVGAVELECVSRERVIQNITLSKALGVYGGAILCSHKLRTKLMSSRLFAGSTPLPLPLAAAAIKSLEVLRKGKSARARLIANTKFVRDGLRKAGFDAADNPGPIVPLHIEEQKDISRMNRVLLGAQILPPLIKYLDGPAKGYFRFVISSEHSAKQLNNLVKVFLAFAPNRRS